MTIEEFFARMWEMLIGREHGPFTFRLILQPLAAVIFAIRAGLRDAREGRPPYFSWPVFALAGAAFIGRRLGRLGIDPRPAYAASESVAAYAIGSIAAFWLIDRMLGIIGGRNHETGPSHQAHHTRGVVALFDDKPGCPTSNGR